MARRGKRKPRVGDLWEWTDKYGDVDVLKIERVDGEVAFFDDGTMAAFAAMVPPGFVRVDKEGE